MRAIAAPDFDALREALAREARALLDRDSLTSIRVITPGDLAREEARRDLAVRLEGFLGIAVVSIAEWIREIAGGEIHRAEGRRLNPAAFERLAARALEATAPDEESPQADPLHGIRDATGVARMFAATIQDVMQSRHAPEDVDSLQLEDPLRKTLADVFREFHRRMHEGRRFDACREESTAARLLRESAGPSAQDVLFFFGFHDLTAQQREVVDAAALFNNVVLFVPGVGESGESAAASLLEWAKERGEVELHGRRSDPLLTVRVPFWGSAEISSSNPERVQLATFPDECSEIRGIARRIRRAIEEEGRAFDEFLIVVPREGPSPRLIRRIFAKGGIPLADRAGIPLSKTFEGRRAAELARHVFADAAQSGSESWSDLAARFRTLHRREFSENPGPEVEDAIAAAIAAQDDEPADAHAFARELTAALDLVKHRTPAQGVSSEGRVLLIRVDQARGFSRAVVFYPGCVAGAILPPPHEDPLLPDRLRDTLNGRHAHEGRVLPLRGAGNDEAILLLRFALECASESAVFSWSKRERTGGPLRLPAGILVDLAASRANRALDPGGADFLELVPPDAPSFARELPVDLTDLELSFVRDEEPLGEPEIARLLAEGGGRFFEPALEAVRSRWRPGQLTAHDGVLHSPQALQAVQRAREKKEHLWSPTALERALTCPFSFLVTQILGLQPPRPEQDDFTPLECGSIIHASLEEIYGALQREGRLPLDPKSLPLALEKLDRSLDGEREALSLLSTAQRLARSATLAAIRQDLASLLSREAHLPEVSRTVPLRFELCFGFDFEGASPALEWTLPSGRTIRLRGRIDRIDVTREGLLEVIDYKSGKIALKWGEIAGIDRERAIVTLQLALYAEAATRTIGQNVSRALLRSTSSRTPSKEAGLTREHLAQHRPAIEALLDRALDLSERGWFPSLPGKGCCRDELACACGPSPRARFLRKRGDAQLEAHLNLLRESM